VGIYCRLYLYAQRHVKSIRAVTRPMHVNGAAVASPCHVSDHKAAITVGVIMGVFLVCWVPFFTVNIVAAFCKTCIPDMAFKVRAELAIYALECYHIYRENENLCNSNILRERAALLCDRQLAVKPCRAGCIPKCRSFHNSHSIKILRQVYYILIWIFYNSVLNQRNK